MAIAIRAQGAAVSGVANLTPVIPAAQLTGDMMICVYGTKPWNDAPTIDQGWTGLGESHDGEVAAGVDVGSMQTRLFYKIATSDAETDPTVTNSTNNVSTAYILVFSKAAAETWATPVAEGGGDATAGTDFSVTVGSDIGIAVGDFVVVGCAFRSDAATPVTANVDITATGTTFTDTKALATDPETTSGGDMGMSGVIAECTAGPSSAAAVITATLAAAHTGSARIARLRVTADRRAEVSFTELETPLAPRRAQISFAELESPDVPRRAQLSFTEFEVPTAPRRAQVSFAELEAPDAPRRGQVSFAEFETAPAPRRLLIAFAELEAPTATAGWLVQYGAMLALAG